MVNPLVSSPSRAVVALPCFLAALVLGGCGSASDLELREGSPGGGSEWRPAGAEGGGAGAGGAAQEGAGAGGAAGVAEHGGGGGGTSEPAVESAMWWRQLNAMDVDLAIGEQDSVLVAARSWNQDGIEDLTHGNDASGGSEWVTRLSSSGATLWSRAVNSSLSGQARVLAGQGGNSYLFGSFHGVLHVAGAEDLAGNGSQQCVYLTALDPAGAHRWSREFCTPGWYAFPRAVAVDGQGRIALALGLQTETLVWLDQDGHERARRDLTADLGLPKSFSDLQTQRLAFGEHGELFVVAGHQGLAMAAYEGEGGGGPRWSRFYQASGVNQLATNEPPSAQVTELIVDGGDAVLLGSFPATLALGGEPLFASEKLPVAVGFVARISGQDGAHQWSFSLGAGQDSQVLGASRIAGSGDLLLTARWGGATTAWGVEVQAGHPVVARVDALTGAVNEARQLSLYKDPRSLMDFGKVLLDGQGRGVTGARFSSSGGGAFSFGSFSAIEFTSNVMLIHF